jgi:hypothetical protein
VKVLVDTFVVLEFFLNRDLLVGDAELLLCIAQSKSIEMYVTDRCLDPRTVSLVTI